MVTNQSTVVAKRTYSADGAHIRIDTEYQTGEAVRSSSFVLIEGGVVHVCWKQKGAPKGSCQKKIGRAAISALLGGETGTAGMKARITKFKMTPANPASKSVAGTSCQNYQIQQEIKMSSPNGMNVTGEVQATACLAKLGDTKAIVRRVGSDIKDLMAYFGGEKVAAEAERYIDSGIELEVQRTTAIQLSLPGGKSITQKVSETVRTKAVKQATFDPSIFRVPSDYQIVDEAEPAPSGTKKKK
jgi:hypothetical protein